MSNIVENNIVEVPTEAVNMIAEDYIVHSGSFEGPLELLLSLVEKRKLFVNEISLSQVTDDYLGYIHGLTGLPMEQVANFIVVAATLILVKSRSLLPNLDLTPEERTEITDLESRLKLYGLIQDITSKVKIVYGQQIIFKAPVRKWREAVFNPDPIMTVRNLAQTVMEVLARLPVNEIKPEITIQTVISIEDRIQSITSRISSGLKTNFRELSSVGKDMVEDSKEYRTYVIVSFLAMLELVRGGIIDCLQDSQFGDIELSRCPAGLENTSE